LLSVWGLVLG